MTVTQLDEYLSRAFPVAESINLALIESYGNTYDFDGSTVLYKQLLNAHMDNSFILNDRLRSEHPEHEGLLIHLHSRFSKAAEHSHDFFEMMYVRSGQVVHHIEDQSITLATGDFLLLAPGIFHCIDNCGKEDIALNIAFNTEYLTPSFLQLISHNQLFYEFIMQSLAKSATQKGFIRIKAVRFPDILETADMMLCEYFEPDVSSANMLKCLFPNLLNRLFRAWKESGGSIRHRRNVDDSDVQQILRYIETNFAAASLKDAAVRFGYHPDYLSRLMKNRLGYTFSDIKHLICIDQAKFLLLNSDLTVQQVAEHVGFSNMSFFYELFDRYCETTPAKYREDFGQVTLQL